MVKSWSEIWLYWWPQDDACDGYLVSWCADDQHVDQLASDDTFQGTSSNCSMDITGSSVALRHMQAFTKYVFSMRAYRWLDANRTERLFSRPLKSQPIVLINPSKFLSFLIF